MISARDLRRPEVRQTHVQASTLALAAGCLILSVILSVPVRRLLLSGFCRPPGWRAMATITWIPLVGKYIPGKVFSLAGTMWMLRRYRVREPVAVSMLFMANGLSMALGLALAIPLALWRPLRTQYPLAGLIAPLLFLAFVVCLHPAIFGGLCNFLLRKLKRSPLESMPSLRHYFEPLLLMLVNWTLTGLALWLITRAVLGPLIPLRYLPLFVATAALAATIGLMVFIAPAGFGVREGIQKALLTVIIARIIGQTAPLSVALIPIIMRLLQIGVEMLLVMAGVALRATLPAPEVEEAGTLVRPGYQAV